MTSCLAVAPVRRHIRRPRRRTTAVFNEARRAEELARTTNVAVLRRAATMPNALFAAAIARNPHCPPDLLAQLVQPLGTGPSTWPSPAVLMPPRSYCWPLARLMIMPLPWPWPVIRRALPRRWTCLPCAHGGLTYAVLSPKTRLCPPATLAALARTSHVDTLVAVLNNAECPIEVRWQLAGHRASAVARAAEMALAREGFSVREEAPV